MKAIFFEGMNLSGKSSIMADVKSRLVKEGFIVAPERDSLCEPFRRLMHEPGNRRNPRPLGRGLAVTQ